MARYSDDWKICIQELLGAAGCKSGWTAERYTNGALSHAYINKMMYEGLIPSQPATEKFLKHFLHNEELKKHAIRCMSIAGYAIPEDWEQKPADPVERVQIALNGVGELEDYQIEMIKNLLERHKPKDK